MAEEKVINIKVNTSSAKKGVNDLNKSVDNLNKEVKETSKSSQQMGGTLDKVSGGAVSKFTAFKGAVSNVATGFKSLRVAIIASGIGALAIGILAIVQAFKRSEEGQNKFAKLMGVIGAVTGQFLDLIADLGENIISAFENPKKAIKDFVNLIKDNIITRFEGLLELLPKLGKAITLLFSGEFSEAGKVAADAVGKVALGVDSITNSFNEATEAVKNFAKETLKEANIAANIADKRAKADKSERALIVARAKANRDIAELRESAADKENVLVEDRIKALEKAAQIEEEITKREIQAANLRLSAKVAENALGKSTKADLDEEANLRARVINLETARLRKQKALTAEVTTARREANSELEAERKAIQDKLDAENKTATENEAKRLQAIKAIQDKFKAKEEEDAAQTQLQKLELEQSRALAELDFLNATEEQKYQVKKYWENIIAEEKILTDIKTAEEEKRIAEELAKAKETEYRNNYDALQNILSSGGKKMQKISKALAIADVARTAFQSVSQTVSGIGAANAKAIAASPLTGGMPFVAVNTVKGALSIASTLASSAKSIQAINSESKNPSGAGGGLSGGGGGGAAAPSFNIVGQTGTNQLAQSLGQNEQQPVQAFVVASQVTTQQGFDNNIVETATLG